MSRSPGVFGSVLVLSQVEQGPPPWIHMIPGTSAGFAVAIGSTVRAESLTVRATARMPRNFYEESLTEFIRQVHRLPVMIDDSQIVFTNFFSLTTIPGVRRFREDPDLRPQLRGHWLETPAAGLMDTCPDRSPDLDPVPESVQFRSKTNRSFRFEAVPAQANVIGRAHHLPMALPVLDGDDTEDERSLGSHPVTP